MIDMRPVRERPVFSRSSWWGKQVRKAGEDAAKREAEQARKNERPDAPQTDGLAEVHSDADSGL